MNNEAFEKWVSDFRKTDEYNDDSFLWGDMAKKTWDACQSASADKIKDLISHIDELESDARIMAEIVLNRHQDTCIDCTIVGCKKGLTLGRSFIRDCCNCPACLIAAKYREGK